MSALVPAVIVFIGTVLAVLGISQFMESRYGRLSKRMSLYGLTPDNEATKRTERFPHISSFLERRGYEEHLRIALARASIPMKPSEFIVISALLIIIPAWIALMYGAGPLVILLLGGLGWLLPRLYLKHRENQRVTRIEEQLANALSLIATCLRSGYGFMRALQQVADEMPAPISEECHRVVRQANMGISTEDALKRMVQRVPSYDLDLVVTAVMIQMQVGGNLAEVLENIGDTIRERTAIKGEIRVYAAEARISAIVLGVLPIVMAGILMVVNPGYLSVLYTTPLGLSMSFTAFCLQVLGIVMLRRLTDLDF